MFSPSHRIRLSKASIPGIAEEIGRTVPRFECVRVNFGVLSISQPQEQACLREFPCFAGFFGVFLESRESAITDMVQILEPDRDGPQCIVVLMRIVLESRGTE